MNVDDLEVLYLVEDERIVISISGQVHAPMALDEVAKLLNRYHAVRAAAVMSLDAWKLLEQYEPSEAIRERISELEDVLDKPIEGPS
jgi:hypothetical protein